MNKITKFFEIKGVNTETHEFEGTASGKTVDRDSEVILPSAFKNRLPGYMKNPVMTWAHRQSELPVGKVLDVNIGEKEVTFRGKFASEQSQFAAEVERLYAAGFLKMFSVGFIPITVSDEPVLPGQKGRTYTEIELLEIAFVPIGSNREALIKSAKGEWQHEIEAGLPEPTEPTKEKGTVEFKALPLADVDRTWHPEAAVERLKAFAGGPDQATIDWPLYRSFFTIDDPEAGGFLGCKLPHHDIVDGKPVTVFRGLLAAIAVLNGARGGIEVSPEIKRAAYEHLAQHVKEFGREAPPFQARVSMSESEIETMRAYHLAMAESYGLKVEVKQPPQAEEITEAEVQAVLDDVRLMRQTHAEQSDELIRNGFKKHLAALTGR